MASGKSGLTPGMILNSSSTYYLLLEFIGKGAFGEVAKCLDVFNKEVVAVKILRKEFVHEVEKELSILSDIGRLDAEQHNMVTFHERFEHMGYTCLVFEMLDIDMFHLLVDQCNNGSMYVEQIRPIAKQLLVALENLQSLGITHADIKPDNIMMVDLENLPCLVKLIDFGQAFYSVAAWPGDQCQATGYRAPEVSLGLPFTEAIDMWGLGCSLAFLFTGCHLFPVHCEYLMMKVMVEILGMPLDHQLCAGKRTRNFFRREQSRSGAKWRLLTPQEYAAVNHTEAAEWPESKMWFTSLNQLVNIDAESEAGERDDKKAFVNFLKGLLHLDGNKRLSPSAALQHPFITMDHLRTDPAHRGYLSKAENIMLITNEARAAEDWDSEL